MQYKFINEKKEEELVDIRDWSWIAIYKDGSVLKEFDDMHGVFHQFKEINLNELDVFVVINTQHPQDLSKRYEFHMSEGMTPIFYWRVTVFNMKQHNEVKVPMPHFGYKENINGTSVKTIITIFPNGAHAIRNKDGREHLEA